jgi:ribosomal protein S27AE
VRDDHEVTAGGDPVCWLSRVCPDCGLFLDEEPPVVCGRCGARVTADGVTEQA